MHMSARTCLIVLVAGACRPAAPKPDPGPRDLPPFYLATPDRLYTEAPLGDGLAHVPVTENTVERRVGALAITLSYPAVDLPDDDRERELAAAIHDAAGLDAWLAGDGHALAGAVKITCVTPIATTALVSLVCERVEATVSADDAGKPARGELAASAVPALVARTFDVRAAPVRPLTWEAMLLPGVGARLVVAAALADAPVRDAWLAGQCSSGDPGFTVHATGLDVWPDERTAACPTLTIDRTQLVPFLIPNDVVARTFRLAGPFGEPEPADAPLVAQPEGAPAGPEGAPAESVTPPAPTP